MRSLFSLIVAAIILVACQQQPAKTEAIADEAPPASARNVILLVGDGMGLSQVSAAQFYQENTPNFERFPVVGLIKTSASDALITDSAAGTTAFASGVKTYNGAIGVDQDSLSVPTLVELLSKDGMSTGVIATSSITHATPAAFYAHAPSRRMAEYIADQLPGSQVDFFAGGGLQFFSARSDGKNVIETLNEQGFVVDTLSIDNPLNGDKLGYLLADDGMPTILDGRGDFLPKATKKALDHLNGNTEGFFLVIEGSQIDWGGHGNDADYLISELLDFDKTIGQTLDFAEKDGNTLVVVTADHETGGFTLSANGNNYNEIAPTFSTGGHSATMIPVFAYGPGAEEFGGIYPNNDIFAKVISALDKE
jgi:alkaline phosphatase